MNRMNPSGLNIGTYYLASYAGTKKHIRELAECGIDMVVNMRYDRNVLDIFHKYGVGAIVTGILPGWFGGDGSNAGTMCRTNALEKYIAAADGFEDHPAIWGIDTGDEPSALDFPHYGRIFECVKEKFPRQLPYLNIYPSYGVEGSNTQHEIQKQLGTETYTQYMEAFCKNVMSDYICFDYYLYSADIGGLYETLSVVSDACLRTGRSMWTVLQVNSHQEDKWVSTNQLRFQAYSALAFGAEVIIWACYTAGWWYNHVLDGQGNKTQQYYKLKEVNAELHILGEEYMKYRHLSSFFVGNFSAKELEAAGKNAVSSVNTEHFWDLKADEGQKLLVGVRRSYDSNKEALMICAADNPYDDMHSVYNVTFRWNGAKIQAMGREGMIPLTLHEDGMYSFEISSCEGILLTEG